MSEKPRNIERPRTISIAGYLLFANAICLLLWWILHPQSVESNGAQVFFIVLWLSSAVALLLGIGWVRHGIFAICIVSVIGIANAPSIWIGWSALNIADQVSRVVALIVTVLVYLPSSRQWFLYMREQQLARENELN